jgi:ATP-dependent DNA ligase
VGSSGPALWIAPTLAHSAAGIAVRSDDYAGEPKLAGWRCILSRRAGSGATLSRHRRDLTTREPFELLHHRSGSTSRTIRFAAFDLLYFDRELTID